MAASPSPNHEDPKEEPEEDPEKEPEEASKKEDDDEADWDKEMNEPELIFPYVEVGSPKPPSPESSESKTQMTVEGGHVQRVTREGTRVESVKLKRELEAAEISNTLLCLGRERTERDIYHLRAWTYDFNKEMVQAGVIVVRPLITMPPRRLKRRAIERMVQKRVDEAIAEYERNRTKLENAGGSGPANAEGVGVAGLRRWIEKVEQVFEISKCAEEDKVKFDASTFEGRALTWWNGNVYTLGLVNANRITWNEFKDMMTTEYCPATEIQRMEQELWTLTLKGNDIEGYNNRFHELALMCPELVTPEKKEIERYIRELPKRIKANVTSSKPANLHDVINMAHELVEQAIQAKDTRIRESNKRRREDHQGYNNNRNHNIHHQQQNRRQKYAKAYTAAPAERNGYLGTRPLCNQCNLHHDGQCPPKCKYCKRISHQTRDCWSKTHVADKPPTANNNA
ncbi:putative reverse transcriptase domain-containing protein [Tanacetum coccineum]